MNHNLQHGTGMCKSLNTPCQITFLHLIFESKNKYNLHREQIKRLHFLQILMHISYLFTEFNIMEKTFAYKFIFNIYNLISKHLG